MGKQVMRSSKGLDQLVTNLCMKSFVLVSHLEDSAYFPRQDKFTGLDIIVKI